MYITLKASAKNEKSVFQAFAPLTRFFDAVMKELPERVESIVANVIAQVFEAEGGGSEWAGLAYYTQAERVRLGYSPERPILVREGTYMDALTEPYSPYYVSEYESSGEGSFIQRIGTTHPLFPWHEKGTEPPHDMPARPATPVGDEFVYEVIVRHLNEYLDALLEEALDA